MGRWTRIVRGMIGTGLTFAVGVGGVATILGTIATLIGGGSFREVFRIAGRLSVAAFLLGIGFSAILAITSRSRRLVNLSIPRFASLGAGAGLIYFGLISINGVGKWSLGTAILNFLLLTGLGAGSAAATLLLARRGRKELESEERSSLGPGDSGFETRASAETSSVFPLDDRR
ncbi:MAG TPA: hypothetical protein VGJ18_08315 [Gemmatimonadaceae bacterium]